MKAVMIRGAIYGERCWRGREEWKKRAERLADGVNQEPKKESPKHLLITHNLQSITQRAVRRNKDHKRHNSALKRLINTVPAVSTHLLTLSHYMHRHSLQGT